MNIRDARNDELLIIRQQRVEAYEEHAENVPEGHWKALKQAITTMVELQPGVERIVAELNNKIVGSVMIFPAMVDAYEGNITEINYPEIRMLAVTPKFRGKGIARALIYECIKRTKEKGFQSIGLHTGEFMNVAIGLYESLGFERIPKLDFEPAGDGIIVKAYRKCLS